MVKLKLLRIDSELERLGRWFPYPAVAGVSFLIARMGNPAYDGKLRRIMGPRLDEIRSDGLDDKTLEAMTAKAMAGTVLLGWKGLDEDEDAAGEKHADGTHSPGGPRQLEFTEERAEEILSDPDLRDLYRFVLAQSSRIENFRRESAKGDAGN